MSDLPFGHDSRFQKRANESKHFRVPDSLPNSLHQQVMVDVIEAPFDVALNDVIHLSLTPSSRIEAPLNHCRGIHRASSSSKPIRGRIEIRLENGLQDDFERHLYHSIAESRYAQWSELTWFPCLWDEFLSHRLRRIPPRANLVPQLLEKRGYPARSLLDLVPRHAIYAWSPAALVSAEVFPGQS
jgi:hypothetical protein